MTSDLEPACPRCRHRHRTDLPCWRPPYSTAITRALLADNPPCWLRYPRCRGAATEADHIQPRAKGGDDEWTNLRPACQTCNRARAHAEPFPIDETKPPSGVTLSKRWQ